MDQTIDTMNYFIAGYTVIFTVLAIYVGSLALRWRNLRKEEEILKDLEK
jgi:hypothetical protein